MLAEATNGAGALRPLTLKDLALTAGWRFPFARSVAPRRPLVLLYHGVPRRGVSDAIDAEAFEQHVAFLVRNFAVVPAWGGLDLPRRASERLHVVLTFDDGFRNNAEVAAPILRRHGVPATFFVCSRHATPGRVLWVAYFKALKDHFPEKSFIWRGERFDMSGSRRRRTLARLWDQLVALHDHPAGLYRAVEEELPSLVDFVRADVIEDCFAGMTPEHLRDLAGDPLFEVGSHTENHPFLSRCAPSQVVEEVTRNKAWVEEVTGRPCRAIAYPSGDYTRETVRTCREAGFQRGFAVDPRVGEDAAFEVPRVGVYSRSVAALGFKVQWGHAIRSLQLPFG